MKDKLEEIKKQFADELKQVSDIYNLNLLKAKHLGRKGSITNILKGMKDVSPEERPLIGKLVNEVKDHLESEILSRENEIQKY